MKPYRRTVIWIIAVIAICTLNAFPAQAIETTFFGNVEDDGTGCSVFSILNLVIDILSIGVGILGVIGISVAGIQYLTAKDNESQIAKAKRRIYEIILGLVAYAILYTAAGFLLPGGKFNDFSECGSNNGDNQSSQPNDAENQPQGTDANTNPDIDAKPA